MKRQLINLLMVLMLIIGTAVVTVAADTNLNWYKQLKSPKQVQTTLALTESQYAANLTTEEQQMVELVNRERMAKDLQPLQVDMRLVQTAREKAVDLIVNNYFEHNSPVLGLPFDQMRALDINYEYAGENLAGSSNVEKAQIALMKSPTHRANILFPNYTHIGVGIIDGGPYGKMFVQHFIALS